MPKKNTHYRELYQKLDYKFTQQNLLNEAMTRQSAIQENLRDAAKRDYQRLEFLGDRILNFSVLLLLIQQYPHYSEENLIQLCSQLTANNTILPLIGQNLQLERYFIKSRAELVTDKMYADGVEALLGAICLDSDFHQAQRITRKLIFPYVAIIAAEILSQILATEPVVEVAEVNQAENEDVVMEDSLAQVLLELDDNHFESGVYEFRKTVLSWTLDSIQHPLSVMMETPPLPKKHMHASLSDYYNHFRPLILEETRAALAAGIELVRQEKKSSLELIVTKFKQAGNNGNPSVFEFSGKVKVNDDCRGSTIGLLLKFQSGENICELLALADLQDGPDHETDVSQRFLKVEVVLPDDILLNDDLNPAFEIHAHWQAYVLCPLITYMRMYDACTQQVVFNSTESISQPDTNCYRKNYCIRY